MMQPSNKDIHNHLVELILLDGALTTALTSLDLQIKGNYSKSSIKEKLLEVKEHKCNLQASLYSLAVLTR